MKSKKIKLLLTGAGTQTFGNVVSALREQKEIRIHITGCDIDPLAYGLYLADNRHLIPKASSRKFIPEIMELCKKKKIDVLIPLLSKEFPKLSKAKAEIEKNGTILPISSYETIKVCNDKKATFEFFVKNSIPTPETYLPHRLPKETNFPLMIKPRCLSGSKYVYKIETVKQLKRYQTQVPSPIIQKFLHGQEYTIDILSSMNFIPVAIVPRVRLKTMDGKSVRGKTVDDPQLISLVNKIVRKLKLIGPGNIQCFREDGKYYFTEINPRFSAGGLPLTVASGVNTPLLLLKMALGGKLSNKIPYKKDLYMLRFFTEIIISGEKIIKVGRS